MKNRRAGEGQGEAPPDPRSPTAAMEINEVAEFQTRNDRGYCRLERSSYTVVKKFENDYYIFYAIATDRTEPLVEPPLLPIDAQKDMEKYDRQIAFIVCTHGWILKLNVFEYSLGDYPELPRRCGVGTLLTELCLIDPHVNNNDNDNDDDNDNRASQILAKHGNMFDMSQEYCKKLVGLDMEAKFLDGSLKAGGSTYLTAAYNMKYLMLMVDTPPINSYGQVHPYEVTIYFTNFAF